jgi:hypothetical protein
MNQLQELIDNLKAQITTLLTRIEESPQFEKLVMSYEALDPRHQKRLSAGAILSAAVLALFLFFVPLWSVIQAKSTNTQYYQLIGEMQAFNTATNVTYMPAPRPLGFNQLPTSPVEDLENSLGQFLANIGVPQDLFVIEKSPTGFSIKIEQISIRQVVYVIFQIDGWHPALKYNTLSVNVSKEKSNLLDMKLILNFDAQEAEKLHSTLNFSAGSSVGLGGGAPVSQAPGSGGETPPTSTPGGGGVDYEYSPPPPAPMDDFGSDLPPPPPFDEDL